MRTHAGTKVALALIALAGIGSLAQEQPGWELTGTVTYNSKSAKGAWVSAEGPSGVKSVGTDGQGRYSLKGDAPGLYTVRAFMEDEPDEHTSRSLTLAAGGHLEVDFPIPNGAVLSGRVVDRNKQPIAGVIVRALSKSVDAASIRLQPMGEDRTNDLGEYRIAHLPQGVYVISVTAKPPKLQKKSSGAAPVPGTDYPLATFYSGATALEGAMAVEIRSGEEQSALDIVLQKQTSRCISFKIGGLFSVASDLDHPDTFESLEPWLGPSVMGVRSGFDGDVRPNESNRVCGVVAGTYRLSFLTISQSKVASWVVNFRAMGYLSVPVTVRDENVDLGSLDIPGGMEMRGAVSIEGAPQEASIPAGIQVRLLSTESRMLSHDDGGIAPVQPDGSFKAPRVFPGDYAVRVTGLPAGYYVVDVTQQGRSVRNGGFRAGNGDLKVALATDGAIVSGRVMAADDTTIPDAAVVLLPRSSGRPLVVHSDQMGFYRFVAGVAPGEYRLAASSFLMEGQEQDAAAIARIAADGTALQLNARESKTVDLRLQQAR
jgi:hypothetical protein